MKRIRTLTILLVSCVWLAAALCMTAAPVRATAGSYVVKVPVLDVRRAPSSGSERVTQVLYNERLQVISTSGGWAQVRIPDQKRGLNLYPGWVQAGKIAPAKEFSYDGGTWAVVNQPSTTLYKSLDTRIGARKVYFGTYFKYLGYREAEGQNWNGKPVYWLWVKAFDGEEGWLFHYHTEIRKGAPFVAARSGSSFVRTAALFQGAPYHWGGMTVDGIDCSGLTYMVYRFHGYFIPRDADDQFSAGTPVGRESLQPGDLVFFGSGSVSHVGIYAGDGGVYHASSSRGVVYDSLDDLSSRYLGARRYID